MGKLTFDDWIRSEQVIQKFKKDLRKNKVLSIGRKLIIFPGILLILGILISIISGDTSSVKIDFSVKIGLIFMGLGFILPIILILISLPFTFRRDQLTTKEFVICLFNKLGNDIKNFSKEQKIGEEEAKGVIKILKRVLDYEGLDYGFNFENIVKLRRELYNLIKYFELKINKNEIDNQADSIFLKSIARDIYNESTQQKIIDEIIAKHKNDFEVGEIKEFRFNKQYIFIGILFIALIFTGIYFKIVDKKEIFLIIATFFITIVFKEMLGSKK